LNAEKGSEGGTEEHFYHVKKISKRAWVAQIEKNEMAKVGEKNQKGLCVRDSNGRPALKLTVAMTGKKNAPVEKCEGETPE